MNSNLDMRYALILVVLLTFSCGQKAENESSTTTETVDTSAVIAEGEKIMKAAFQTLSSNLQRALSEGGVNHALKFCKVEAIPLTDSLSTNYNVIIQRVSHRPRNPANKADSLEMLTIKQYLKQIKQKIELEPLIHSIDQEEITFHAPIKINNPLCLNCHGKIGTDITNSDLKTISQLYPEDQATGFEMGELRGLWKITFPKFHFE